MNITLWIVAGGLVGFIAFVALHLNLGRGLILSMAIGTISAFFGGYMLAPMFGATVAEVGGFDPLALLVAAGSALACLSISDMTSKRFGL